MNWGHGFRNKLAAMAHDGLARAINPVHTATDGDALFALATGRRTDAAGRGEIAATGLSKPPIPSARELGLA